MTDHSARTHDRTHDFVHRFLDWFERAPLYLSIWTLPLVIILGIVARVKTIFQGDKQMTTATASSKPRAAFNLKHFAATALAKFSESIGDMVITVAVTGITLAYMFTAVHPILVDIVAGYYIAAMLVVLFIRIIHRFDESYTVDEIGERLEDMDASLNDKLEAIRRNV